MQQLRKHKHLLGRLLSQDPHWGLHHNPAREGCHPCLMNLPKGTASEGQSQNLNPTPVFHLSKDLFCSCLWQPWETGMAVITMTTLQIGK